MATDIETALVETLARHLRIPPAELDLDMPVEEAADSLELSGFIVAVEERFRIRLPNDVGARLRVLRDLIPLIEERTAGRR